MIPGDFCWTARPDRDNNADLLNVKTSNQSPPWPQPRFHNAILCFDRPALFIRSFIADPAMGHQILPWQKKRRFYLLPLYSRLIFSSITEISTSVEVKRGGHSRNRRDQPDLWLCKVSMDFIAKHIKPHRSRTRPARTLTFMDKTIKHLMPQAFSLRHQVLSFWQMRSLEMSDKFALPTV